MWSFVLTRKLDTVCWQFLTSCIILSLLGPIFWLQLAVRCAKHGSVKGCSWMWVIPCSLLTWHYLSFICWSFVVSLWYLLGLLVKSQQRTAGTKASQVTMTRQPTLFILFCSFIHLVSLADLNTYLADIHVLCFYIQTKSTRRRQMSLRIQIRNV